MRLSGFLLPWVLFLGSALFSCSSAPAQPQETVARKNTAADYLTYGQNYYQQGNYPQALRFFQLALEINTSVDNTEGIAASYDSVASTLLALDRVEEARLALKEAEKAALGVGDFRIVLQTLNLQVQVDLAEQKIEDAWNRLSKVQPFPNSKEGADLWQALGVVERDRGHGELALSAFQKSLSLNTSMGLKQAMASNHFMIGSIQAKAGDSEAAFTSVREALELDKNVENSVGIGQDLRVLGLLSDRLGREDDAWDYLVRSQRVFQAISLGPERLKTVTLLIPLAQKLKRTDDLTYYQNLEKELSTSSPAP